jgi:hypothetical protein
VLALPTAASAGSNIGAGTVDGTATFDAGYGIPPGPTCGATRFSLSGDSKASVVVNTIIKGFVGQMTLTGSGSSPCETAAGGAGQLTFSATSTGNNFLSCPSLTGGYTRFVADVSAQLGGTCTINNLSGVPVSLTFHGDFVPDGLTTGAGSSQPITSATFAGAYVLLPG